MNSEIHNAYNLYIIENTDTIVPRGNFTKMYHNLSTFYKDVSRFSKFIRGNRNKKKEKKSDDYKFEKLRYIFSINISHYNHIKGSSKRPVSFKNCIV